MKILASILLTLMLAISAVGCGDNPCEAACDKMQECGVEGTSGVNCSGDCPSEYEPMMNCIADLTCEEMEDGMKFMACLSAQ